MRCISVVSSHWSHLSSCKVRLPLMSPNHYFWRGRGDDPTVSLETLQSSPARSWPEVTQLMLVDTWINVSHDNSFALWPTKVTQQRWLFPVCSSWGVNACLDCTCVLKTSSWNVLLDEYHVHQSYTCTALRTGRPLGKVTGYNPSQPHCL